VSATIRKWLNSAAVRIPARVLASAGLNIDQQVDIRQDFRRIIIEAKRIKQPVLHDLLKQITADNFPKAVHPGPPMGREQW